MTTIRRRRVLPLKRFLLVPLGGAVILGVTLYLPAGSPAFLPLTGLLAAWWLIGAVICGGVPLALGAPGFRAPLRVPRPVGTESFGDRARPGVLRTLLSESRGTRLLRHVGEPLCAAALLAGIFALGALFASHVPVLRAAIAQVTAHVGAGPLWVVALAACAAGIAEEAYFRGSVYTACAGRSPILLSTLLYALITAASGNLLLVLAALLLGAVAALLRARSGAIWAPMILHAAWSLAMLWVLPLALG
ncbi:CPBP family glutamic-type intramembrane protease [Mycetocola spongiae]|uniref:CPBP family glutamic-type intramembrane protease n=1 Tax=Mycetocola spongiae TaxID=2859226 RepID=UPI001CF5482E|nr:CPBP family glutamic-type intramembrane protease [Mycetocola spongiae]UCR89940.1 CPBP family intramembrane metalloprotease [Mycetocola spongiae]